MSFKKITEGHVVQLFDESGKLISQEFVAGSDCSYEDENGNPLAAAHDLPEVIEDAYSPYDMVQPFDGKPTDMVTGIHIPDPDSRSISAVTPFPATNEGRKAAQEKFFVGVKDAADPAG